MRNLFFVLTLFLVVNACTSQKSYQQEALKYFELNGTEQQYSKAIDQMFSLLKEQYASQNVPENVWQELQAIKPEALYNIKSLLVPAYQSNFSQDDINELILFYESETGVQLVKDNNRLSKEQKVVLTDFLNSEVGKKMQNQSGVLNTMVSEVSESWSKDLYKEMTKILSVKGFKLP